MEILAIIVTNLFTGALVYLILSLKIERTSSTFHEKRLRKEMGEIITEFNAAAERNITILENRISQLRNLNSDDVQVKKFDYTVDDEVFIDNSPKVSEKAPLPDSEIRGAESVPGLSGGDKNDDSLFESFMNKFSFLKREHVRGSESVVNENESEIKGTASAQNYSRNAESSIIEKEVSAGKILDIKIEDEIDFKEEEADENIQELFESSDDKYLLINSLYEKGYSVEELSRYSGLPAGEVRLVVSLNI